VIEAQVFYDQKSFLTTSTQSLTGPHRFFNHRPTTQVKYTAPTHRLDGAPQIASAVRSEARSRPIWYDFWRLNHA